MAGRTIQGSRKQPSPHPLVTVELKGVSNDADINAYLPSPEEEHHETARELWEEEQMNEELTGQIASKLRKHHCNMKIQTEKVRFTAETEPSNTV